MAKKKNKIILDLGKVELTREQRKLLQAGIHKTVAAKMKSIHAFNKQKIKNEAPKLLSDTEPVSIAQSTATIDVSFTNVNPGASELTATCKGQQKKIMQSSSISFKNISTGDTILIQVDSLGSTTATIDISADPAQMNFPPGSHGGTFFIN
jgi:hypothetical protein